LAGWAGVFLCRDTGPAAHQLVGAIGVGVSLIINIVKPQTGTRR